MPTDRDVAYQEVASPDVASLDVDAPRRLQRCDCGRVALARCWLGETFPARRLVSCAQQAPSLPGEPEAA